MEIATAVGGALLSASFKKLFDLLASPELRLFASKKEVKAQLEMWEKNLLPKIHAVLEDAEEKQTTSRLVGIWLSELRDLVYDVEDVLDEFATEALRLKLNDKNQAATTSRVTKFLPSLLNVGKSSAKFDYAEMGSKLNKITARLETICTQTRDLNLGGIAIGGGRSDYTTRDQSLETTSLPDPHVFGRDNDKQAILDMVLAGGGGVSVIPIQGMGGMGKTTLAQLVYIDKRVEDHFGLRAWVCVSDIFHIPNITKTILQYVGGESRKGMTLDQLQVELKKTLSGKRFVIVLDDVWNENYQDWTVLYKPFEGGAPGSKLIVTTRNQKVATMMGTVGLIHGLRELSFADCLSLFCQHALKTTSFDDHLNLKHTGEKIVKRCKGLPLAAKTLGGMLNKNLNLDAWVKILESQIWDLPKDKNNILPALRLSYHHLPSHLKQCFAYCALFPKDYEFDMNELVQLWMAEGFVPQQKGKEDVGVSYFCDLLSRSFFQQSSSESESFVMHDLLHDLALCVAGEICFNLDAHLERVSTFQKVRHSSFTRRPYEVSKRFEGFDEGKGLRTLLTLPILSSDRDNHISNEVLNRLLSKLEYLRTLSLCGYQIKEIPNSANGLKHLRYLNLSFTRIRLLPDFVCSLLNLQTLLLRGCYELEKLPRSIGDLFNLCYLDINGTWNLKEMPRGIGNLTSLRALTKFIVGVGGGDRLNIRELKGLSQLKGELFLEGLHKVEDFQQAREADLKGKTSLEGLGMEWSDKLNEKGDENVAAEVLQSLQPYKDLKRLSIWSYYGRELPSWIGDPLLMCNMVELRLFKCSESRSLPSFGRLPMLQLLIIDGMMAVKSVGSEFYGCPFAFLALETLKFQNMQGWEEWCLCDRLPCLRVLEISNCPFLVANGVVSLPSLCDLKLEGCNASLLRCLADLTSLKTLSLKRMSGLSCVDQSVHYLEISNCPSLVVDGVVSLPSLCELNLVGCNVSLLRCMTDLTSLKTLSLERMSGLSCVDQSVHYLEISNCPSLAVNGVVSLPSLCELKLEGCNVSLLNCITDLTSLKTLSLRRMSGLSCLYESLLHSLAALEHLKIYDCEELMSLWKSGGVIEEQLTCLRSLEVHSCPQLVSCLTTSTIKKMVSLEKVIVKRCPKIGSVQIEQQQVEGNDEVCFPLKLRHVELEDCGDQFIQFMVNGLMMRRQGGADPCGVEFLEIIRCDSLQHLGITSTRGGNKLKRLKISDCNNLMSLCNSEEGMNTFEIEELEINNCPSLTTDGMKLHVGNQIETLPEECIMSTSSSLTSLVLKLQRICIFQCPYLKRLPDSLHCLTNLTTLWISGCDGLEWFPESGLPIPNLKELYIENCRNLKSLPKNMRSLTSLESLRIYRCPAVEFFTEEQRCLPLPPNLILLKIGECSNMKQSMSKWGLHTLTSLRYLEIGGVPKVAEDEATLTPTFQLPTSIIELRIIGLKKVKTITSSSWGIQNLTSLTTLLLANCPKLRYLPKESLPPTLEKLEIIKCPIVAKKCSKGKGKYWPRISLIPDIDI